MTANWCTIRLGSRPMHDRAPIAPPHLCNILLRQLMRIQWCKTSSLDKLRQLLQVYMLQHMTVHALWQATVKQAGWRWTQLRFRESTAHPD